MTLTDLLNLLYTDMDGHRNDCDCHVCLTMDTVQEYIQRARFDKALTNGVE
jgi:hypothetical protein